MVAALSGGTATVADTVIKPSASTPRRPNLRTRRLAAALAALILVTVFGLRDRIAGTPVLIAAAALVPPVAFAGLVLLLDRRDPVPWLSLFAALLWGGTAGAVAAQSVNDAALRVFPAELVAVLIGPFVEEVAKGSALIVVMLVWRGAVSGVREGIIYGALAGLGFAATENLGYYMLAAVQAGVSGLARALYLRGLLQGLNHAAFTAIIGAAVGSARGRHGASRAARVRIALSGLAIAGAVHAAWNAFASPAITDILCNAPREGAACAAAPNAADLLISVPVLIAAFIGPVAVLLVVLALRDARS